MSDRLAHWADDDIRRYPQPQGVALGWANAWAFGPTNIKSVFTALAK